MFRSMGWVGRTFVLAAVLMLSIGDIASARGGGGGGGRGGGGGGGFRAGGGGYRGGYVSRGYYGRGYGGYGRGYYGGFYGLGLGYGDGYPGSDYYDGGYSYPSVQSYPAYSGYTTNGMTSVVPASNPNVARITIRVPDANATVLFDGAATTQTGTVREFDTPPLSKGDYTYRITAKWMENGKEMTKTQEVHVAPGSQSIVNFLPS
jgi:uncharacterized protein (TIGR03000 family)